MQNGKQPSQPPREEVLAVFNYIWKELKLPQSEIARETGLDQGSVSKLLRGTFRKLDGRAYRLWEYAKVQADKAGYTPDKAGQINADRRLEEKINRVWDKTEEGAEALLKLLDAADLIQKRRSS